MEKKIKISPAVIEVLTLLAEGKIAERRIIGGYTHMWFIDGRNTLDNGKSVTRAIKSLIKRKFVDTHYPHNSGSAQINEQGRELLQELGVEISA